MSTTSTDPASSFRTAIRPMLEVIDSRSDWSASQQQLAYSILLRLSDVLETTPGNADASDLTPYHLRSAVRIAEQICRLVGQDPEEPTRA